MQSGEQESWVNPVASASLWCDFRQAPCPDPFNEGLGSLAAEDPWVLGCCCSVLLEGRQACTVGKPGCTMGLHCKGRVFLVLTRVSPAYAGTPTPDPLNLSEITNAILSFFGGNLLCSNK